MTHQHYYITPEVLPAPNATDTEWVQRVTMLGEMIEQLTESTFILLSVYAPVLTDDSQPFRHMLGGLGLIGKGIALTGRAQLQKQGTEPLEARSDQLRIVRDRLADPTISPELRDALLTILAHNLEADREVGKQPTEPEQPSDFPDGGFIIGGE